MINDDFSDLELEITDGGRMHPDHPTYKRFEEFKELARLGALMKAMPKMLEPKDVEYEDNDVDYVQIGVGENGVWTVNRWYDAEAADLGPIGCSVDPSEALKQAYKRLELT